MSLTKVNIQAHAKVNLTLSVGKLLQNGLHPIDSHMVFVDLCDDLEVSKLDSHALSRYAIIWDENALKPTPIEWSITHDLAVRAHQLIEETANCTLPIQMKLQKRIPVESGLGGGSADAAAMLQVTKELFDLDIDLVPLATSLGSDVPFFLSGRSALVSGVGASIAPAPPTHLMLVLIFPPYGCATSLVYESFDQLNEEDVQKHRNGPIFNDLLPAALKAVPPLEKDLDLVRSLLGQDVHLTGSGSTMFVICDNKTHSVETVNKVHQETEFVAIATKTCEPNEK